MIYNVVLGLGVQQSDPVIRAYIFFRLFFEMFFDSSHFYLVIMLIEGFKPFMFCFFLIGYKQTSFVLKKEIQVAMFSIKGITPMFIFSLLHYGLLFCSNTFLLSAMAIFTTETLLIYHFMNDSSSSLCLSKPYPHTGGEMMP